MGWAHVINVHRLSVSVFSVVNCFAHCHQRACVYLNVYQYNKETKFMVTRPDWWNVVDIVLYNTANICNMCYTHITGIRHMYLLLKYYRGLTNNNTREGAKKFSDVIKINIKTHIEYSCTAITLQLLLAEGFKYLSWKAPLSSPSEKLFKFWSTMWCLFEGDALSYFS